MPRRSIQVWLEDRESAAVDAFVDAHEAKHGPCRAAAGGRYTYLLTPTGLGMHIEIQCACGEKLDVTDYGSW